MHICSIALCSFSRTLLTRYNARAIIRARFVYARNISTADAANLYCPLCAFLTDMDTKLGFGYDILL